MTENFHKWYSQWIGETFRMLVFGESGIPIILFPQAGTHYYDYKDFGVIESLKEFVEDGKIVIYCPDSYDLKSWMNFEVDPEERVKAYLKFEQTIINDVVGFAKFETQLDKAIFGGFGFGGYQALNLTLKYPELAHGLITIGGDYEVKKFVDGFFDDDVYYNSPLDYLHGLTDTEYIENYKKIKYVLCSGSKDESFGQNRYISKLLYEKNVNHLFDVYPYKLDSYEACKQVLNNNLHHFL